MKILLRLAPALTGALALSACGSGGGAADGAAAKSEVLKGSVSDEMIAFDTLKSEPPPAKIDPKDLQGGTSGPGSPGGTPDAGSAATGPTVEDAGVPAIPEASEAPAVADE